MSKTNVDILILCGSPVVDIGTLTNHLTSSYLPNVEVET